VLDNTSKGYTYQNVNMLLYFHVFCADCVSDNARQIFNRDHLTHTAEPGVKELNYPDGKTDQDKKKALHSSAIQIFPKKECAPIVRNEIKYLVNQMAKDNLSLSASNGLGQFLGRFCDAEMRRTTVFLPTNKHRGPHPERTYGFYNDSGS
jgi:hypothetical protein